MSQLRNSVVKIFNILLLFTASTILAEYRLYIYSFLLRNRKKTKSGKRDKSTSLKINFDQLKLPEQFPLKKQENLPKNGQEKALEEITVDEKQIIV